jgi:hypothetical protein
LEAHVASVYCKYFRDMLQVFHTDVAKVDRDVTYVATVDMYVANSYSQCFIFFLTYVVSVLSEYCICCKSFIWMLGMFTMILSVF